MIMSGILCLILSLVGKFGAVLSTMPDPAIGGAMFVTFGILGAIGIFTLRSVNLTSSRNLAIFGLSLYTGIVIPEWVERYPEAIATGNYKTLYYEHSRCLFDIVRTHSKNSYLDPLFI